MSVRDMMLAKVRRIALGNTGVRLKHVASDLLNAMGTDKDAVINAAEGTFLCRSTIERVMECPDNYRPQSETIERVFLYVGAEITVNECQISAGHLPKPKSLKEQAELKQIEDIASGIVNGGDHNAKY